ncbi:hypothetical protein D3C73_833850 [compost metagenome]
MVFAPSPPVRLNVEVLLKGSQDAADKLAALFANLIWVTLSPASVSDPVTDRLTVLVLVIAPSIIVKEPVGGVLTGPVS